MTTVYESNQYANQTSVSRDGEPGETRIAFFEGVTATADTGTINLIKLPPGKLRILLKESGFFCSNMAATAQVSVGTSAYIAANGATVTAAVAALKAAAVANAVTGIANYQCLINTANGGLLLDSQKGVTVTATVSVANTAANGTYSGWITYSYLG